MSDLDPESSVTSDRSRGEVYFAVSGFFSLEQMNAALRELDKAAYPIAKAGKPVRVFGDMTGFVAQDRATGEAIRDHLVRSLEAGLQKVALVAPSALVRMQYEQLSQGVNVGFFRHRDAALEWLRSED